jgi:HEAT repeat protein
LAGIILAFTARHAVVLCRLSLIQPVNAIGLTDFARECLESDDHLIRRTAVRKVGEAGTPADAVPILLRILHNDTWQVASEAAWSLGRLQSPTPEVIDGLRAALDQEHQEVRRYAAFGLAQYGARSRPALPRLIELLSDERMGYMACRAVGQIGGDARTAIADLVDLTGSSHLGTRCEAVRALGKLGPLPPEAIVAIERCCNDDEEVVRYAAREALQRVNVAEPK